MKTTSFQLLRRSISLLIVLLLLFKVESAKGQLKQIIGKIRDSHSEEPIPFATVQFSNSTIGKLSDSSGSFVFTLRSWPSDSLIISYAGFEDYILKIDTSLTNINVLVKMERKKATTKL